MKKLTKSFVKESIKQLKEQAGLTGNVKATNENLEKINEWCIYSSYDPKGIDGQNRLTVIMAYINFVNTYFTFSVNKFIELEFENLKEKMRY